MTALENVTIAPLKIKKRPKAEVMAKARTLLSKVGLGDKLDRYPDELSGGQQQRVAIARALALKPEILLLDEVTAALDPELVSEVLDSIRLLAREGMTMLIVSHEMGFIREVSSRVAFLAGGRILEIGAPLRFSTRPVRPGLESSSRRSSDIRSPRHSAPRRLTTPKIIGAPTIICTDCLLIIAETRCSGKSSETCASRLGYSRSPASPTGSSRIDRTPHDPRCAGRG